MSLMKRSERSADRRPSRHGAAPGVGTFRTRGGPGASTPPTAAALALPTAAVVPVATAATPLPTAPATPAAPAAHAAPAAPAAPATPAAPAAPAAPKAAAAPVAAAIAAAVESPSMFEYLTQHEVATTLNDVVNELGAAQPADPYAWLATKMAEVAKARRK